jgi:uncharacterized protein (DUF362 family)
MDRRRFLTAGARLFGAGLLLPWAQALASSSTSLGAAEETPPAAGKSDDAIPPYPDLVLGRGEAKAATHKVLDAMGGMQRFVQPGQVVLIKPNASFACPPDWGATTHPDVLTAVLEACFAAEARRVLVVDHTMLGAEQCFDRNGTAAAVAVFPQAKLISLDKQKAYRKIEVPAGKALHSTEIPILMSKADVFINLPSAKSHAATGVSLGLKNLMGLIWDRHIFHQEIDLHQGVADLATVLRPQLTILDAVRILKTGGPTGPGTVDVFDGVIAGTDPVAVDAYGVGLAAWNNQTYRPEQIAYIKHAVEHGLGTATLESLRIQQLG